MRPPTRPQPTRPLRNRPRGGPSTDVARTPGPLCTTTGSTHSPRDVQVTTVDDSPATRDRTRGTTRPAATSPVIVSGVGTSPDERSTRATLSVAIIATIVLVLLMPATPLVVFVLIAAVALGAIALAVRHAELRRGSPATLEDLGARGYTLLADRRSPGLTGTIDRLIVGPGGVFVVELRDDPGHARVRGDLLVIDRHSYDVVSQLRAQVAAVAATLSPVLDGTGATVVPLLCMRAAELPMLRAEIGGMPLLREHQLVQRIATARPLLGTGTVLRLQELIERTMPPAVRSRSVALAGPTSEGITARGVPATAKGG